MDTSLDTLLDNINNDTNMNPLGESNSPGNRPNQTGGSNSGGGYNPSPRLIIETYKPAGSIPVQNDKELGVLIAYRYNHGVRALGYSY
jgi:hypothetical protein